MFFGCFLPKKYLPFHLLSWPLVYLHWKTNNNKCVISQIEYKLKYNTTINSPTSDNHDDDYYFMKKIFKDIGADFSNKQLSYLTYSLFTISWIISFFRYFIFINNNVKNNLPY
jgi:hypothetical protein